MNHEHDRHHVTACTASPSSPGRSLSLAFAWLGVVLISVSPFAALSAGAQPFEAVYGAPASVETTLAPGTASGTGGSRGLVPVRLCGGGGFVVAGTTVAPGGGTDVYVVRTDGHGHVAWERRYDIGTAGADDRAAAVIELLENPMDPGFVVAGTTRIAGNEDVFLLRLDCRGAVRWARSYGSAAGLAESAADLIEVRHGANLRRRGDLVVAGTFQNPADGLPHAALLRAQRNGALIWSRRYDRTGTFDHFTALTEARDGDLVAVGITPFSTGYQSRQGYAIRVAGHDGAFHAPRHCAAMYFGELDASVYFRSVIELTVPPHTGELVIVGKHYFRPDDVLLVRTGANPCSVLAGGRFGDKLPTPPPPLPPPPPFTWEEAEDVREVRRSLDIAQVGQLVVVGSYRDLSGPSQAFLGIVDPDTLSLVPDTGRLYGGDGDETATAVVPRADGFVLAGSTTSDPQGVGDPGDLYLVRTDTWGHTACSATWSPLSWEQEVLAGAVSPTPVNPVLAVVPRPTGSVLRRTGFTSCE